MRTFFASGESIGQYTVDKLVGPGHHTIAYRAHDAFGNTCMLKVLLSGRADDLDAERAADTHVSGLRHPHLAARLGTVEADDVFAVATDYIDGPSLRRWLEAYRPTPDEVLALFRGVIAGVDALHQSRITHGALNPGNVLLGPTDDGLVTKVADFGVVRPPSEMSLYAARYLAPEVLAGGPATDESDLWSLGAILYELAAGLPPYSGMNLDELQTLVSTTAPTPIDPKVSEIPPAALLAIEQCLKRDPTLRPQSCDDLSEMLYGNTIIKRIAASREQAPRGAGLAFASSVGLAVARSLGPGEGKLEEPSHKGTASVEAVAQRNYKPRPEPAPDHTLGLAAGASFVGFGLISLFCALGMLGLSLG